jgi:hypothetical protein
VSKVLQSDIDKRIATKDSKTIPSRRITIVIYTNSNEEVMTNLYSNHDPFGKDLSLVTIKPQPTKEV